MMACGRSYHDERGDVQDCAEVEPCPRCLRNRVAQLEASVLQAGQVAVDRNALQELMITGSYLATAAYNLKQQDTLKPEWRQSLGTGQTEWDAALANLRRTSQTTKTAALKALRPAGEAS